MRLFMKRLIIALAMILMCMGIAAVAEQGSFPETRQAAGGEALSLDDLPSTTYVESKDRTMQDL